MIFKVEPLEKGDIDVIHAISLEILKNIGVKFDHEQSLRILEEHGSEVDWKSRTVKFDPDYVEYMIKKVPSSFSMHARDPKKDLELRENSVFFATANAIFVMENGKLRDLRRDDLINYIRLADALNEIHICVGANFYEAPKKLWDLYEFEIMLLNTSKHLRPVVGTPYGPKAVIEMAARVVGDYEQLRKRPILSMGYAADAPLRWSSTALKVFMESAKYNIPVNVESEPITGATSPITLAGTLALANAEVLSGIVFNQMLKEGRPTVYSIGFSHTMDMKTAACLSATPECFLIMAAGAQIARYYNIPSLSWVTCDSKIVDLQSACEKAMGYTINVLSGNNIIWGAGSMEAQASISFEQMIIDSEIIGYLERIMKGIDVNDEMLALDIIKDVGVGGNYLSKIKSLTFTRKYYLKEHAQPKIFDRKVRIQWEKEEIKDIIHKAKEKVREILKEHQPATLDPEIQKDLRKIIEKYKRKIV